MPPLDFKRLDLKRLDLKGLDLDRLVRREPGRAARWMQERLPEVSRPVERGGREALEWVQARLPSPRDLRRRQPLPTSVLWPTFIAAAGAGAAFWWWTSWSRGRAEAERARLAAEEGAAHPDAIMAHAPPPPDIPAPPHDPSALDAAAESIMAHAPPPPKGKSRKAKSAASPKATA